MFSFKSVSRMALSITWNSSWPVNAERLYFKLEFIADTTPPTNNESLFECLERLGSRTEWLI